MNTQQRGAQRRVAYRKLVAAIAGAIALLVPLATSGASARPKRPQPVCPELGQVVRSGNWTIIKGPPSDAVPPNPPLHSGRAPYPYLTAFAVSPADENVIFAAQPDKVFRSTDGGCHWQEVLARDVGEVDGAVRLRYGIISIMIPEKSSKTAYVLRRTPASEGLKTILTVTLDGGDNWNDQDPGISGHPVELIAAPSDPNMLYLSAKQDHEFRGYMPQSANELYASTDGGKTWELRYKPLPISGDFVDGVPFQFGKITIDPLDPRELWMIGSFGGTGVVTQGLLPGERSFPRIIRSRDGGSSWEIVDLGPEEQLYDIDIFHSRGHQSRIAISGSQAYSGDNLIHWSEDGGTTWSTIPSPIPWDGTLAHAKSARDLVFLGPSGFGQERRDKWHTTIYRLHPGSGAFLDLEVPQVLGDYRQWLDGLSATPGPRATYYVHARDDLTIGGPGQTAPNHAIMKFTPGG